MKNVKLLWFAILAVSIAMSFLGCDKTTWAYTLPNMMADWEADVPESIVEHNSTKGLESINTILLRKAKYNKTTHLKYDGDTDFTWKVGTEQREGTYEYVENGLVLHFTQAPRETLFFKRTWLPVDTMLLSLDCKDEFVALAKTDAFWKDVIELEKENLATDRLTEKPKDFEAKKFDLNFTYLYQLSEDCEE